jgi:hypothetical protein
VDSKEVIMPYSYEQQLDYSGGVARRASDDLMDVSESQILDNYDIDEMGALRSREGTKVRYSSPSPYSSYYHFIEFNYVSATGTSNTIEMALYGGYIVNLATGYGYGAWSGYALDYEVFNNKLFVIGGGQFKVMDPVGVGTYFLDVADSTSGNILSTVKKCERIEQRGNRLFLAANPESPNSLYFSEVGSPNVFLASSGNPLQAITDDGDVITALKEYNGQLVVFKRDSVFAWSGFDPTTDVTFKKLRVHTGCTAYKTVQYLGNLLVYKAIDGVYALQGLYEEAMSSIKLSDNIQKTFDDAYQVRVDNGYSLTYDAATATVYKDKYLLAMDEGSPGNNYTFLAFHNKPFISSNGVKKPWSFYTNIGDAMTNDSAIFMRARVSTLFTTSEGVCVIGQPNTPKMSEFDANKSKDTLYNVSSEVTEEHDIKLHHKTSPLYVGAPLHIKKYRRGLVLLGEDDLDDVTLTIKAYVDDVLEVEITDAEDATPYPIKVGAKGRSVVFEVISTALGSRLSLYGYGVEYKIKKPTKGDID